MAVKLFSLVAALGLDGKGFQRGLDKAGKTADQFAGDLKSKLTGAFTAGAVVAYVRHVAQAVGRVKDLSEQFSVTTDEVQKLDAAAKQSGQTFEDMGTAIEKVGAARKDAAEGNEELRATFSKFGVSLEQLNNPAL